MPAHPLRRTSIGFYNAPVAINMPVEMVHEVIGEREWEGKDDAVRRVIRWVPRTANCIILPFSSLSISHFSPTVIARLF